MYKKLSSISFPEFQGNINVNMMPIIFGDNNSIPQQLHAYLPLIQKCTSLTLGKIAYLTIHESFVKKDVSQRRPGIHTEGTRNSQWGGGNWGGKQKGLYFASNDGSCRVWDSSVEEKNVDELGSLLIPVQGSSEVMNPNTLYWLTDRTPHEALLVMEDTNRQFFRLVSDEVSVWWSQHSTPNPLGVQPDCKILTHNKF